MPLSFPLDPDGTYVLSAIDSVPRFPCHGLAESGLPEPIDEQDCILPQELETMLFSASDTLLDLIKVETEQGTIPKPLTELPPTEIHLGKQPTRTLDEEVFQHGEHVTGLLKEKGLGNLLLNTEGKFDSGIYGTGSLVHDSLTALSCLGYKEPLSEQVPLLPEVKEDEHVLQQNRIVLTTQQGVQTRVAEAPMEFWQMESVPGVHGLETDTGDIELESPLSTSESTLPENIQTVAISESDRVAIDTAESQSHQAIPDINDDRKASTHFPARVMRSLADHSYGLVKYPFEYTVKYMMKPFAGWTGKKSGGGVADVEVLVTSTDVPLNLKPDVESHHSSAEQSGITGSLISRTYNAETSIDRPAAIIAKPDEQLETSSINRRANVEHAISPPVSIMITMVKVPYKLVKIPVDQAVDYAASIAGWGWKKLWGGASGQGIGSTSTAGESALEHGQECVPAMVSSLLGSASSEVDIPEQPIVSGSTVEEGSTDSQE